VANGPKNLVTWGKLRVAPAVVISGLDLCSSPKPTPVPRRILSFRLFALVGVTVLIVLANLEWSPLDAIAKGLLVAVGVVFGIWLMVRLFRRFLWRVGRRLAFSYFLIGVLPAPLLLLLLGVLGYLLSSFFLGHLFRDAAINLHRDLALAAETQLAVFSGERRGESDRNPEVRFGYYEGGVRVAGDVEMPAAWPEWLPTGHRSVLDAEHRKEVVSGFVAFADGVPAMAASAGSAKRGVLAVSSVGLEALLSERSDVWVQLMRADDPAARSLIKVRIGNREYPLQPFRREDSTAARDAFFSVRVRGSGPWDRPILVWGEATEPLRALADGSILADSVVAALRATPRTVHRHLFSSQAEVNTAAWAVMLGLAAILLDIYIVALLMAAYMIFGLSRAVNRLSAATEAVRRADFSLRIPVRRRDQVGELQRSFNEMSAHLQELVASAAQKEALEQELAIARSVQESLLPTDPPTGGAVEFATHFEPSAAIGGDYFDILRLDQNRVAVVIADVSGHGLSAGLRMAMVKGGLQILVEEAHSPEDVFRRLDSLLRARGSRRSFVSATLALLDLASGRLEITNAGHPPCYVLSEQGVEEIVLPSSALGGIGQRYARAERALLPGDTVVWLSDGLIEACDPQARPFGYDSVVTVLAGGDRAPHVVRQRLLAAVAAHAAGQVAEDDRTLVVMRYAGGGEQESGRAQ
jgi:serine phosphatase RsbU (regulator of sigma subunit)